MGAAAHLGIDLREYDARIRTFVQGYDAMLQIAAAALATAVRSRAPLVVDLGIGTGGLSAACLRQVARARIVGVDEEEGMLAPGPRRLGPRPPPTVPERLETPPLPPRAAAHPSLPPP